MVSRLGLGLAALGRPGYINVGHGSDLAGRTEVAGLEQHAHTLLDAAHEGGVRYFRRGSHLRPGGDLPLLLAGASRARSPRRDRRLEIHLHGRLAGRRR
jgi:hypothetical protein